MERDYLHTEMDRDKIKRIIEEYTETSPRNHTPDIPGLLYYREALFSVVRADDPWFEKLKEPQIVGDWHSMPEEWVPDAKTVLSFFLPFHRRVAESNAALVPSETSKEWLYARVEGQEFLFGLAAEIREAFEKEGYTAVVPSMDPRLLIRISRKASPGTEHLPPYNSNWSERHIGFVSGLGTFGVSTCFISKAGTAGRLFSIVTNWDTYSDEKDYTGWLDYCTQCGACRPKCPVDAFRDCEPGIKEKPACALYNGSTRDRYVPRYGCGKCQCGVPCSYTAPGRFRRK